MSDYNDFLLPDPCLRMDTHFGDEYESVEFGDGTGYVKAAPMLARFGALHVELDELRDENAKLRDELDAAKHDLSLFSERIVELGAENAKLRMFIDLKQTCWKYVGLCDECPYNGVDDEHDDCNCTVREKVNSLAHKLGVEVE